MEKFNRHVAMKETQDDQLRLQARLRLLSCCLSFVISDKLSVIVLCLDLRPAFFISTSEKNYLSKTTSKVH